MGNTCNTATSEARGLVNLNHQQWCSQNAHQRETTSNNALQLRPFSKWELLLMVRICSQRERILSFMSSPLKYENYFYYIK